MLVYAAVWTSLQSYLSYTNAVFQTLHTGVYTIQVKTSMHIVGKLVSAPLASRVTSWCVTECFAVTGMRRSLGSKLRHAASEC